MCLVTVSGCQAETVSTPVEWRAMECGLEDGGSTDFSNVYVVELFSFPNSTNCTNCFAKQSSCEVARTCYCGPHAPATLETLQAVLSGQRLTDVASGTESQHCMRLLTLARREISAEAVSNCDCDDQWFRMEKLTATGQTGVRS